MVAQVRPTLAALSLSLVLSFLNGCQRGANPTAVFAPPDVVSLGVTGRLGPDDPAQYGGVPDRLAILSFNMEHKDRPNELAVMAERLSRDLAETPDFILLQEVVFGRSKRDGAENTGAVLAKMLGYHARGTKRSSDREGISILSRYPFAYYAARRLETQTSPLLLGFNRVSVMGEFIVPHLGRVRVVNVHLTNWGFEAHVRRKQIEETLEWLAAREQKVHADVTILGGDFNSEPGSRELELVANHKLGGTLRFENWNGRAPTRGPEGRPNKRLDYIFVASAKHDLQMVGERRLWLSGLTFASSNRRFWLSDHVPVLHEYNVPQPLRRAGTPTLASRTAGGRGITPDAAPALR